MVAVIGPGDGEGEVTRLAEAVGAGLARAGATVVCGGLGGVMAAACRGVKAEGGLTVGLLPGDDRAAANPWVDVAVATGLGDARNALVVRTGDVVVACGGGVGTLSEMALAIKIGRPVVGLRCWSVRDDQGAEPVRLAVPAADAEEAVRTALALAPRR